MVFQAQSHIHMYTYIIVNKNLTCTVLKIDKVCIRNKSYDTAQLQGNECMCCTCEKLGTFYVHVYTQCSPLQIIAHLP